MKISLTLLLLFCLGLLPAAAGPRLFLVGDSTMSDMPPERPRRGWGMSLPPHFTDPAMVSNRAVNGESSMSYIASGHWSKILAELQPGDFVLVQFGHNDEKPDPSSHTDPATTFRDHLRRYVRDARAKGAAPILATPVSRRKFDAAGTFEPTHGAYPDATRAVAKEEGVPLLDLEKSTSAWLAGIGDEASQAFFMGRRNPRRPPGHEDIEHLTVAGAAHVAELAAGEIRARQLPLAKWLRSAP